MTDFAEWVGRVRKADPRLHVEAEDNAVLYSYGDRITRVEHTPDLSPERAAHLLWAARGVYGPPAALHGWLLEGALVGQGSVHVTQFGPDEALVLEALDGTFLVGESIFTWVIGARALSKDRMSKDSLLDFEWDCQELLREAYADLRLPNEAPRCLHRIGG